MSSILDGWEKRLDQTDSAFERYRVSGFELVATIITLAAGTLGMFHKALSPLEVAALFLPVGVAVLHQRCRYQGLKEYAHARLAASQLTVLGSRIDAGEDELVSEHRTTLLEYVKRSDESNLWFGYADQLCDFALLLLFVIGVVLFFKHIVPSINCYGK